MYLKGRLFLCLLFFPILISFLGSCDVSDGSPKKRLSNYFSVETSVITEITGAEAYRLNLAASEALEESTIFSFNVFDKEGNRIPHHLYGGTGNSDGRISEITLSPGSGILPVLFVPDKSDVYKIVVTVNGDITLDFYILGDPLLYSGSYFEPPEIEYQ